MILKKGAFSFILTFILTFIFCSSIRNSSESPEDVDKKKKNQCFKILSSQKQNHLYRKIKVLLEKYEGMLLPVYEETKLRATGGCV